MTIIANKQSAVMKAGRNARQRLINRRRECADRNFIYRESLNQTAITHDAATVTGRFDSTKSQLKFVSSPGPLYRFTLFTPLPF